MERFVEYVESAEKIQTGRQSKCKLDRKTKKLFCVKGRLAESQKVILRLGEGVVVQPENEKVILCQEEVSGKPKSYSAPRRRCVSQRKAKKLFRTKRRRF